MTDNNNHDDITIPIIDISPFGYNDDNDDYYHPKDDSCSSSSTSLSSSSSPLKLTPIQKQTAQKWDDAMTNVGFAIISGHGVSSSLIDTIRQCSLSFFQNCSIDEKQCYHHGPYGTPLGGYSGIGIEAVGQTRTEHGGWGDDDDEDENDEDNDNDDDDYGEDGEENNDNNNIQIENTATKAHKKKKYKKNNKKGSSSPSVDMVESYVYFPDSPKKHPLVFADIAYEYHLEMQRVLSMLHRITEAALNLPHRFFDEYYKPCGEYFLRLAYYPPLLHSSKPSSYGDENIEEEEDDAEVEDDEGEEEETRYGAHTDYTGFTILLQDDEVDGISNRDGGLQVKLRSGDNNKWYLVKPHKHHFVVNIGDLYEVWTNGKWKSTVHRVLKPSLNSRRYPSDAAYKSRLSIPFFTGPRGDSYIVPMERFLHNSSNQQQHSTKEYKPVTAKDHLLMKLAASNA